MALPADRHVHSEWSWDAANGSMERTCARAVEMGLPAVAFTEHVDHDAWPVAARDLEGHEHLKAYYGPDGMLTPGRFDLQGYTQCLQRCREMFPALRIISGVELGEPHWHAEAARQLLAAFEFDLVLGSVHGAMVDGQFDEVSQRFLTLKPQEVIREYLAEVLQLVTTSQHFSVLAHIDYPVRYWSQRVATDQFRPSDLEDEFREVLTVLAESGRTLELNTRTRPFPEIVRWWRESGGESLSFGSDAHDPTALGVRFAEAAALAEAQGFQPGLHPHDLWRAKPGS